MTTKTVTPADIIAAAEENGYIWHREGFWDSDSTGVITKACILGQVSLNLGIDHQQLWYYLKQLPIKGELQDELKAELGLEVFNVGNITHLNDNSSYGVKRYKKLVSIFKRMLQPHMNHKPLQANLQHLNARKSK